MGPVGVELSFLDEIEIDDKNTKSVKFNKDEMYMLKFVAFKNMKFSGYVKQLIISDIKSYCNNASVTGSSISKEDIKQIMLEVFQEGFVLKEKEAGEIVKNEEDKEALNALAEFGINKR